MLSNRLVFAFSLVSAVALAPAHAGEMLAMNSSRLSTSLQDAAPSVPSAFNRAQAAARPAEDALALTADTDLPQRNLWQRIRSGYALPELDTPLVMHHERWYANQPEYMARMTERARLYLYFIVREVERRNMPTEIALLPMIESAFNPTAYSVSRASGIWQFIPSTGKHFGMQQNWWYDRRRDVIEATNGALDYLQKLHDEFGDWELALAAYNYGENGLHRAIARNQRLHKPTDLMSLRVPKETRNYVPKLLAMKHIIGNPASYGLVLADVANEPYFAAITPPHHIDVSLAAELAEITMDDFKALNPSNSRPVILQDESALILLPADKAEKFITNLEAHDKPLVSWQAYQSKKGEPLDKLAARFNIPVEKLKSANGIMSGVKVSNGQQLLVPAAAGDANKEFVAFNMHLAPTLDDSHLVLHTVRKGETLGSIARHYHVSLASLKSRNGGHTLIRPGQRIAVAGSAGISPRRHHARVANANNKRGNKSAKQNKATSVSARPLANTAS